MPFDKELGRDTTRMCLIASIVNHQFLMECLRPGISALVLAYEDFARYISHQ